MAEPDKHDKVLLKAKNAPGEMSKNDHTAFEKLTHEHSPRGREAKRLLDGK